MISDFHFLCLRLEVRVVSADGSSAVAFSSVQFSSSFTCLLAQQPGGRLLKQHECARNNVHVYTHAHKQLKGQNSRQNYYNYMVLISFPGFTGLYARDFITVIEVLEVSVLHTRILMTVKFVCFYV